MCAEHSAADTVKRSLGGCHPPDLPRDLGGLPPPRPAGWGLPRHNFPAGCLEGGRPGAQRSSASYFKIRALGSFVGREPSESIARLILGLCPRKPRKGPRRASGDFPGASGAPGHGPKNLKTHAVCRGLLSAAAKRPKGREDPCPSEQNYSPAAAKAPVRSWEAVACITARALMQVPLRSVQGP